MHTASAEIKAAEDALAAALAANPQVLRPRSTRPSWRSSKRRLPWP
ncbi:hypothetical protein LP420_31430 [Massilia sp. B-10]|nr:hypothetical protein LP420_31430 [Massilia sp. B-10]UUZ53267.1 hypothetical protein LP419_30960 [Massilia sp. H-1]